MTVEEFTTSLNLAAPPEGLSSAVQSLWLDGKGDWKAAHEVVDELEDAESMWVHAYLHRKEGDNFNAGYWYKKAGKLFSKAPLEIEWETILMTLL
jgi:hypothetical protein